MAVAFGDLTKYILIFIFKHYNHFQSVHFIISIFPEWPAIGLGFLVYNSVIFRIQRLLLSSFYDHWFWKCWRHHLNRAHDYFLRGIVWHVFYIWMILFDFMISLRFQVFKPALKAYKSVDISCPMFCQGKVRGGSVWKLF